MALAIENRPLGHAVFCRYHRSNEVFAVLETGYQHAQYVRHKRPIVELAVNSRTPSTHLCRAAIAVEGRRGHLVAAGAVGTAW